MRLPGRCLRPPVLHPRPGRHMPHPQSTRVAGAPAGPPPRVPRRSRRRPPHRGFMQDLSVLPRCTPLHRRQPLPRPEYLNHPLCSLKTAFSSFIYFHAMNLLVFSSFFFSFYLFILQKIIGLGQTLLQGSSSFSSLNSLDYPSNMANFVLVSSCGCSFPSLIKRRLNLMLSYMCPGDGHTYQRHTVHRACFYLG